ncbi:MAG TPA: asparaginase domain-containing protein [Synergistaceae bacterium]|nr:asparaginase domain-containing protein [Synergistaceae bacterium]HPJ25378.1 asparaginase domain-containing protein [Synergistaceae bacterium]HPQ36067.1 asparaginase domain-containing protein [Synergistaceae bacterium]
MKRVVAILTGGTIASAVGGEGALPDRKSSSRLEELLRTFYSHRDVEVSMVQPWGNPGYDSSDIGPLQWIDLARVVVEEMEKGDLLGVIILHGTDTMAYTASWLSIALRGIPLPVILTGSQLTLDYTPEDVLVNLRGAAQVTCTETVGVWIYFNWKLIPGNRGHKARATHPDAFIVQNGMPISFSPEWALRTEELSRERSWSPPSPALPLLWEGVSPELWKKKRREFRWIFCAPGMTPHFTGKERILGLLGFGSGNAPQEVLEALAVAWPGKEKPCILACSQAEGDRKKPDAYGDVGIASLASRGFSVWNQGDASLEFVHALVWYALLCMPEKPEKILEEYLEKI